MLVNSWVDLESLRKCSSTCDTDLISGLYGADRQRVTVLVLGIDDQAAHTDKGQQEQQDRKIDPQSAAKIKHFIKYLVWIFIVPTTKSPNLPLQSLHGWEV